MKKSHWKQVLRDLPLLVPKAKKGDFGEEAKKAADEVQKEQESLLVVFVVIAMIAGIVWLIIHLSGGM